MYFFIFFVDSYQEKHMTTKMLINAVDPEEFRVAFTKDGMLDGFHIETTMAEQRVGNIYRGTVERVEPSLQSCFVNFGVEKNGFLPIGDVHPEYFHGGPEEAMAKGLPAIEKVIRKGQELLVQVTKEMPGRKGAHLTTYISIAGRYLVLTPGRTINGVSRKIEDEAERQRLKEIMAQVTLPEEIGYIVRTVAVGQNKRELSKDLNRLLRMWREIKKRGGGAPPLSLIHKEQDLCFRTLRDYFTSDVSEVLVDDKETYLKIKDYMKIISPLHQRKVKLYKHTVPIFDRYEIEDQIESIFHNTVNLKSGGSIVIDPTEALIAIDVNSGKGKVAKDVENMAFRTNMEAAQEIARQLRLRDIGGLVVVDFIDMRDRKHNREVEKTLREELKKDRAKTDTSALSKFGILELSRERLRPSIESKKYHVCPHCQGRGMVMSVESAAVLAMRRIWVGLSKGDIAQVEGKLCAEVAGYLQNRKRKELLELENRYGAKISLFPDPDMPPGEHKLEFIR